MSKKDTKKQNEQSAGTDEKAKGASVAVAEPPFGIQPLGWVGNWGNWGNWVDQWPSMVSPRLAEWFDRGLGTVEPMRIEEYRDDDESVIRVEIPGVDPDKDIDISVVSGRLAISARREQRHTEEEGKGRRSEFRYGSFRRTLSLPEGVTADDVKATYADGILEIRVPIDGEAEAATKVTVKRR
jgi:HSP20 family protein